MISINKRGISPIISAVLLIAMVITLFLLVSNWIQSSVVDPALKETGSKLTGELECLSTKIEISDVTVTLDNAALNVDNIGDTTIDSISIRVITKEGSATLQENVGNTGGPLSRILSKGTIITFNLPLPSGEILDKIEVYPVIDGKTCSQSESEDL